MRVGEGAVEQCARKRADSNSAKTDDSLWIILYSSPAVYGKREDCQPILSFRFYLQIRVMCDRMQNALGDGAMVARLTLDQLIKVRILVSQPEGPFIGGAFFIRKKSGIFESVKCKSETALAGMQRARYNGASSPAYVISMNPAREPQGIWRRRVRI